MLTEERLNKIISIVNQSGSVTTTELMQSLDSSESTIRRDLAVLDRQRRLVRVRGGAISVQSTYGTRDDEFVLRQSLNTAEKEQIASYAASLIQDGDFVFIDAGTTTEHMIPHIHARDSIFVTNALSHAKKLSEAGYTVYVPGGEFKALTEAIVGEEAISSLKRYHFTKGFFGVNGVDVNAGFTTPEIRESIFKEAAMKRTRVSYVLADATKLGQIAAISFGAFEDACVITNKAPEGFGIYQNVMEVSRK